MAFQPVISKTQKQVGVEALIRKIDRAGEVMSPEQIFKLDENTTPLNKSLIDYFAAFSAIQYAIDNPQFSVVNFNASVITLTNPAYINALKALSLQGMPSSIVLEITETESVLPARYFQLAETIATLKQYGFRIALDDFGCGHACLRLLRLLSPSIVKFSRYVLDDISSSLLKNDKQALEIMETLTINLLQERGIKVIMEGIENTADLEIAKSINADYYQGFYFGRPELHDIHAPAEYSQQLA